jgi:hypothetical protein
MKRYHCTCFGYKCTILVGIMNYKTSAFLKKKKNYKTSEKLVHSGFSGKLVFGLIKFDFF